MSGLPNSRQRLQVVSPLLPALVFGAAVSAGGATNTVVVNSDGSFSPAHTKIFHGGTVEWQFHDSTDAIVPISGSSTGSVQDVCMDYLPYDPADPNEFTGPMPQAVSGIFTISPQDSPYASSNETWQSQQLTGVFIRMRWNDVHLGEDTYFWDEMDAEIDQAIQNGKVYSLGFKAGSRGTPQWIFDPAMTSEPVSPLDFGFMEDGQPALQGSPADLNFRTHYFYLLRAVAAHLRERNAAYRALSCIKISGLNLHTHENRLPSDTPQELTTWAGPGQYTPDALFEFYDEETVLLATEFPDKDMSYALIQGGFPEINNAGEYAGMIPAPTNPVPSSAQLTEEVLGRGRTNHAARFIVQHNGLGEKPSNCPGSGIHPITVDTNFHYVGSGCPNRWVLAEAEAGQVTGYQTVNSLDDLFKLESTFSNAWDNSDCIFLELYEGIAQQADTNGLPSGMSLGDWADQFHQRRLDDWPWIPDPFPLTHRHTFTRASASGSGPQFHFYINSAKCSGGAGTNYGVVAVLPDLSFTSIRGNPDGTVSMTLGAADAGTLRIEQSNPGTGWTLLEARTIAGGTIEITDPLPSSKRSYRARLATIN
jgi:hypothetical protein